MANSQASSSSAPSSPAYPFANSKGLLEVLPNKIDVEEESRLYDELSYDEEEQAHITLNRPPSLQAPPSVFSNDIWLEDKCGESSAFARDVKISGWTNVGDKPEGAYIVYDCTIRTDEGTTIHAHKRYSDFVDLNDALWRTLPHSQRHFVPQLPPKAPLARYRSAFLDRRRRLLQSWLTAVLLHPDVGGSQAVRFWIMN
ncbi:PX domain-containing protein YPT35 [Hypsizygus marmoreus]|uniref:Endosomal/vacuolar adapter protein YPT35 n=1 Tax=Hypsizygus marmoreus TaxID=39966 RepID=A0A369J717_HYPMA|nr:PX domain-containing protein YPT35 [Hypsizygus marmoreus]